MLPIPLTFTETYWNNSWGPTPDFWFDNDNQNNSILNTWERIVYSANDIRYVKNSQGAYRITMFSVIDNSSESYVRYHYNTNPGNFGAGQAYHRTSGSNYFVDILNLGFISGVDIPNESVRYDYATISNNILSISQNDNRTCCVDLDYNKIDGSSFTPVIGQGGVLTSFETNIYNSVIFLQNFPSSSIKEVVIYFSYITDLNIGLVETYLKNKYNITY